jgi:L-histidine N-alpha-methyltransferase
MTPDERTAARAGVEEDAGDARARMRGEVAEGLSRPQKEIAPKYFYDTRGSELFEEITHLEEYYLTRTERALLETWSGPWVEEQRPEALVELGAGNASKSRVILDAMRRHGGGRVYVPVDVAEAFLRDTAAKLRREYPGFAIVPAAVDFTGSLTLPMTPPEPTWYALLGSTVGNFDTGPAVGLLARVARRLRPTDRFLLGADLRPGPNKSVVRLEAAYNDSRGVTADFNLNVLRVLNRELGSDFDLDSFRHHAFYDAARGRIEMHLVSRRPQLVRIPGADLVAFREGESVRTEISCKYDRASLERILSAAGLAVTRWEEDAEGLFALVMTRRRP